MTTFHEEDSRYVLVQYKDDRKNVTYLYFREGEWYVTESFENSWENEAYPTSRFFTVQGCTGPLEDYIAQYRAQADMNRRARVVKSTLGEFMDSLMFGGKNAKGN